MTKTEIKNQYQGVILEALGKYPCIDDKKGEAQRLADCLLMLEKPSTKRKKRTGKSLFVLMQEALISKFGSDEAEEFFIALADNEQLAKRSIYIPSPKKIRALVNQ